MEIPFKKKTVFECGYHEFEQLVQTVWPQLKPRPNPKPKYKGDLEYDGYSFVADEECSNYVSKTYTVDGAEELEQEELDELAEGRKACYLAPQLLDAMCRAGILEAGDYVISVYW